MKHKSQHGLYEDTESLFNPAGALKDTGNVSPSEDAGEISPKNLRGTNRLLLNEGLNIINVCCFYILRQFK